jgi:hypothetical protein
MRRGAIFVRWNVRLALAFSYLNRRISAGADGHANGSNNQKACRNAAYYLFMDSNGKLHKSPEPRSFGSPATLQTRPETLRPDVTIGLPFRDRSKSTTLKSTVGSPPQLKFVTFMVNFQEDAGTGLLPPFSVSQAAPSRGAMAPLSAEKSKYNQHASLVVWHIPLKQRNAGFFIIGRTGIALAREA